MIKKMRKNKKGFTLIEIIVVLVIMGILLAIAVPSVLGYVNKANDQKYIAQAHNGYLGVQTILTRESVTKPTLTNKTVLNAENVNKEIGETNLIKAVSCNVAVRDNGTQKVYEAKKCKIQLTENDKIVEFEANNTSEILTGDAATITDGATTGVANYPVTAN